MGQRERPDRQEFGEQSDSEKEEEEEQDEYHRGAPRLPWGITKTVFRECPVKDWALGRPESGDKVSVHFTAKLQDGTKVGSSHDTDTPFEFVIGQLPREVVLGMELGVLTMYQTEIAEFKVAPRFAYDDLGSPPLVPPNATLLFEVELLSWEKQVDLFGDGRAVKTVTKKGSGVRSPARGDEVVISLRCTNHRDKLAEERASLTHVVGDVIFTNALSRILVHCLTTMVEGEQASVVFTWDAVTGDKRFGHGGKLDLTLERLFETRDISLAGDGSLVKKVLVEGTGEARPNVSSQVSLRVDAATDGAGVPLPGFVQGTVEFSALAGEVCDALEFAALEMREGERALLTCAPASPQCCEARLGLSTVEAPRAQLTVQLLGFSGAPVDLAKRPAAERLGLAGEHKAMAGKQYSGQRYALALYLYRRAMDLLPAGQQELRDLGAEQAQEAEQLRRTCELNRAACALKLGDFQGAANACDEVLRAEPTNEKALYRRASAKFGLSDYAASLRDLQQVLQQNPQNAEARKLVAQCKDAKKRYAEKAQATAARMIDNQVVPDQKEPARVEGAPLGTPAPAAGGLLGALACLPLPCLRAQ